MPNGRYTTVYFVRHAESPYLEGEEQTRGLSAQGQLDSTTVESILRLEKVDLYVSSPYARAIQTIQGAAGDREMIIYEELRERAIGDMGAVSFKEAKQKVYEEPGFAFPGGESSIDAQKRAVKILIELLDKYPGRRIVMGTHGDIMTLMLGYFDTRYDYAFWESATMPDIYKVEFAEKSIIQLERLWG